jgi:serpin B
MKSFFGTLALLAGFSLLLAACAPASSSPLARSAAARLTAPNAPAADLAALVQGNNSFALDLYRSLEVQQGNLILSPFSISLALAMTSAGAAGETQTQMDRVLHFELPPDRLHPAFNQLDLDLARRAETAGGDEHPLQLSIANGIWAQQGHPFLVDYLDRLAVQYGAGIRLADFVTQPEAVRREINGWVSDQTKDKIKDLLPEGVPDSQTRMVLVNAIYFKADWERPFESRSTSGQPFHLLDGSVVQAEMMSRGMGIPYRQGDGYQAVELPYQGGTAAMDVLVPDAGRFAEFEAGLDAGRMEQILGGMQPTSVSLGLPKFSYTSQFGLADQLSALGMTDAFDPQLADFSGMDGQRDLYIGAVIHKAFVAVDEQGTEAAAATGVIMEATSAPVFEVNLTIDRPFIFLIRDLPSGQILFIGRVLDPTQ